MPIQFPCANPRCRFELVVSGRAAAGEVRCPNCGLVQPAPRVETPSPPRDPSPLPPRQRLRRGPDLLEPPPGERGLVGDCLRSILYAAEALPRMLLLIVVLIGGKVLYDMCFGPLASLVGFVCFLPILGTLAAGIASYAMVGFALRFFLDVTLASLERVRLAPGIPRLGLLALFEYGLMGLAVAVLYVLPLITLPLLPLGILALASWEDTRGLDVRWAFRAARRSPRVLGRLWAILALWCGLLAVAFVAIAKAFGAWVRHLVAASGGRTGGLILASAAEVLGSLVLALVVCVFLFVLFRCSGLLGSHHPEVLDMLPEKPPSPLLLAGIVGAGVCVSFQVHYWLWVLLGRR